MSQRNCRCCNNTYKSYENEAEAYAAAYANNVNFNILVAPEIDGFNPHNSDSASDLQATQEDLASLLKKCFRDDEEEIEAKSEAEGNAIIRNTNVNVIVNVDVNERADLE